jgi:hypothetical protein
MANPCAIYINDAELAKKLGVEVGKRMTYAEFAEKVSEGLLDDIDLESKELPKPEDNGDRKERSFTFLMM